MPATPEDFDRYVAEHQIADEDLPEAFANWIVEHTDGPPPRYEKIEPGDEQILPDREQRDLDGVPSRLAIRDDEPPDSDA